MSMAEQVQRDAGTQMERDSQGRETEVDSGRAGGVGSKRPPPASNPSSDEKKDEEAQRMRIMATAQHVEKRQASAQNVEERQAAPAASALVPQNMSEDEQLRRAIAASIAMLGAAAAAAGGFVQAGEGATRTDAICID
jgi:hypothetical protein